MASEEENQAPLSHKNQMYDESLEVPDAEDVPSLCTPSPNMASIGNQDDNDSDETIGNSPHPDSRMDNSITSENEQPGLDLKQKKFQPSNLKDDDNDSGSSLADDDDEEDDEDDDGAEAAFEGAYDPDEYSNLPVSAEISDLFQYITRYTPQTIELDHCLKPFIPDFIPSVGDIDAFIKVPRPDGIDEKLGLLILDEPCAKQSDPVVLEMQIRSKSKHTHAKSMIVKNIDNARKDPKAIDNWCKSIADIRKTQPPPTVHYSRNMPNIDTLMEEWPPEFEELLKEIKLPSADLDSDLKTYTDMICAILDIPIYKNRIQSLHVLFTLFSEFKNSQHFRNLAADNKLDNALKDQEERLVL